MVLCGKLLWSTIYLEYDLYTSGAWKNLIGRWTDSGTSWTGSTPKSDPQYHYGPARLWTTPVNSDQYGKSLYKIPIIREKENLTKINSLTTLEKINLPLLCVILVKKLGSVIWFWLKLLHILQNKHIKSDKTLMLLNRQVSPIKY